MIRHYLLEENQVSASYSPASYIHAVKSILKKNFDEQLMNLEIVTSAEHWSALYDQVLDHDIRTFKVLAIVVYGLPHR